MNLAKPQKSGKNSSWPVWADEDWLQKHAGKTHSADDDDETTKRTTDEVRKSLNFWATLTGDAMFML